METRIRPTTRTVSNTLSIPRLRWPASARQPPCSKPQCTNDALLDHIVGDREHVRRNCEGERLGGLQEQRPLRRAAWVARLRSRWNRQRGQGRHTPTSCGPLSFPTYPRRAASAVDQRVVQTKTRVSAPPLATLYTAAKNIIAARWHSAHRARRERGPSRQRPR